MALHSAAQYSTSSGDQCRRREGLNTREVPPRGDEFAILVLLVQHGLDEVRSHRQPQVLVRLVLEEDARRGGGANQSQAQRLGSTTERQTNDHYGRDIGSVCVRV